MNNEETKIIMNSLRTLMPYIKDFFLGDAAMVLSDLEKYTYYTPGKGIDHKIKPGDALKTNGLAYRCLQSRQSVFEEVDASVFGFAYTGMAAPLFNSEKELIGTFIVLESIEMKNNREELKKIANEISLNMGKLNQNMDSLLNQAENINTTSVTLKQTSEESKKQVQETNDVLNLIKNIANKTNLLGINAAIEATRLGKDGTGFKVVSDEIRKLSINTNNSIKKIEPIIKKVHVNSEDIVEKSFEINTSSSSIVNLIDTTRNMGNMITSLSEHIDMLADNLVQSTKK